MAKIQIEEKLSETDESLKLIAKRVRKGGIEPISNYYKIDKEKPGFYFITSSNDSKNRELIYVDEYQQIKPLKINDLYSSTVSTGRLDISYAFYLHDDSTIEQYTKFSEDIDISNIEIERSKFYYTAVNEDKVVLKELNKDFLNEKYNVLPLYCTFSYGKVYEFIHALPFSRTVLIVEYPMIYNRLMKNVSVYLDDRGLITTEKSNIHLGYATFRSQQPNTFMFDFLIDFKIIK